MRFLIVLRISFADLNNKINMKKLMLASAIALFGMVQAQETETAGFVQGDTFITGAVGYSNTTEGTQENNTFTIAPSVGYFVSPNFAIGARVGYSNNKTTDEILLVKTEDKTDGFTVGAFGRYYWTPAAKFSLFGELNANYGNLNYTNTVGGVTVADYKLNGFNMGIAPGISYFIAKNFALEASWGVLNYNSIKPDVTGADSSDNFSIGLDLNDLNLGLVYKF